LLFCFVALSCGKVRDNLTHYALFEVFILFYLSSCNIPFIHIITSIRFFRIFASSETFHLYICWILKRKKIKMETEELTIGRVHHGRNIRRTRIEKNMNQEGLSELVHLSQPAVSKYEKMKVIDDEMLQRFARALNVPFDYLKTLEEDAQTVVFENNTVNNSEQSAGGANISMGIVKSDTEDSINDSRVNNFNPIDKITELYERLLKEKDEKYAALERRLQNIEKSLQK
jgi:transcriptional regulator with XRE-family HTH domain